MWVIKNNKRNNYYHSTINKDLKHFVLDIKEAKKMTKKDANKIILNLKKSENYELKEVKK